MKSTHTAPAYEVGRVLFNASLFASTDEVRPVLGCLEVSLNGKVQAVATDSYRLGIDECPTETSTGDAYVLLEAKALAPVVKALLADKHFATVAIATDVDDKGWGAATFTLHGTSWTIPTTEGEYPRWRSFLSLDDAGEPTGHVALNPKFLATLAKVRADGVAPSCARFTFHGPRKPVGVSIGQTFHGLIMPIPPR